MEFGGANTEDCKSLISSIYGIFSDGIHFSSPVASLRTNELDLVRGVLQILQGLSSSVFYWDENGKCFCAKSGIYVSHLSHSSLLAILKQFMFAATCLRLVQAVVNEVQSSQRSPPPTFRAFASSVSAWLKRLRDVALEEEMKICKADSRTTPTLLGLASSLSSLCSGAEFLLQVVQEAIPKVYFESNSSIPAVELAVHVLDNLYKKLNEVCLVQGGQEEAYQMLLHLFVGSLLPYIEGLDSWLFEGTLDDPFEEMFFYANQSISVDDAVFWEKSYLLRPSCPLFIKEIAKSIVSAGKSLQLIRHVPVANTTSVKEICRKLNSLLKNTDDGLLRGKSMAELTLSEIFCVSFVGLIGHGDHISRVFLGDDRCEGSTDPSFACLMSKQDVESCEAVNLPVLRCKDKCWYKFLVNTLSLKGDDKGIDASKFHDSKEESVDSNMDNESTLLRSFCPENPVITVCHATLKKNMNAWKLLNLSRRFDLPPLNDEDLRKTIFGGENGSFSAVAETNFTFGFQFGESEYLRSQNDVKQLDMLFPFSTILPAVQDNPHMSELLPFQKNSTLSSRVLNWIQYVESRSTPLPLVIMQECLIVYLKKQVDYVGKHILSKLMGEWRLMDELAVLRAIYLLGSGDLLQHFLTVIFNKLDKGETWDDDFELNMILQESITNSADSMLLSAPDSLLVSITKNHADGDEQPSSAKLVSTPHRTHPHGFGMDGLDLLKFTYKVSWPLELIANAEAIKKYNQVMNFLLKVKRAKFVLDKARRWMWKSRGTATYNHKNHWLVEQKLLHFVDAFHQYVMDRVYHSAWLELCEGVVAARSLDEVIEAHEAYLLSIQRQCFVVPDKLWALIASRINSILGLALDFYSIQQNLSSGGAVSGIKARCEMEVDRIEKQFDDCIAFLLRVLSFKLNVGHFPHLADLVTRINYNYYYMSDSGNLMTAPSSETVSSRLRKSFVGRTD